MLKAIGSFFYVLATLISIILGIHFVIEKFYPYLSNDARIGYFFIILISVALFVENWYIKTKWFRNNRYGKALSYLNNGFSELHQINRPNSDEISIVEIKSGLRALCNSLSRSFSHITRTKSSVCIKILQKIEGSNPSDFEVRTLCRDDHSYSKRDYDRKEPNKLSKNEAFTHIMNNLDKPLEDYFMSNRLPLLVNYSNTSFDIYGKPAESILNPMRYMHWPLPYKSTIVVPIIPFKNANSNTMERNDFVCGFLCVDSSSYGAFRLHHDVDLMNGIADGLYNTIIKLKELSDVN